MVITAYYQFKCNDFYGDIHASICILMGTCFFAYFIGVLTTDGDRLRIEETQLFCAFHRISRQLARVIVTHIRHHCNYNYLFDHEPIMESIPNRLNNVNMNMNMMPLLTPNNLIKVQGSNNDSNKKIITNHNTYTNKKEVDVSNKKRVNKRQNNNENKRV